MIAMLQTKLKLNGADGRKNKIATVKNTMENKIKLL